MNKQLALILAAILAVTLLSACTADNGNVSKEAHPPAENVNPSAPADPPKPHGEEASVEGQFPKPVGRYTVGRTQMDFEYRASNGSERELTAYSMEVASLIMPQPQIMAEKLDEEEAIETSRRLTSAPEAVKFAQYAVLQSEDVRHVADRLYEMNSGDMDSIFEGRLQLEIGMGVFGHSFGGTTAAIVSRDDERFVGAVNLDGNMVGALDSDLKKPFMQLGTVLAYNTNAFLLESNSQDTYFGIVDGVVHSDFSDSLFTATAQAARGTRDALEQRDIITSYTKAFFDQYLLNKDTDLESLSFDGVEMIKKQP